MSDLETIFVYLKNEGADVWRPTQAEQLAGDIYRILPSADYDPETETWEFPPGTLVHCERVKLSGGEKLVAVRTAASVKGKQKRTA